MITRANSIEILGKSNLKINHPFPQCTV